MKIYIGYLDSKWIHFDEENEVFQYQIKKIVLIGFWLQLHLQSFF